ncbi:MAG: hypothetical protein AABY02_02720 [Nanoarchaeota archaeon]
MDALTIIFISMTAALALILIVFVLVWALRPNSRGRSPNEEMETIKHEIEHEVEQEAEEELMPYKPPRLDKPTKRRL